ncbi:protein of unknown function [Candidatus Nitrotoga arctica]|uniref:Uncharacterized protein n=1 Tax=Candidatus Nitrotoga arctica TaxID=453162 RepID=A0ABN8AMR7_9PROT|nr:protein of unknown function [Candidatus Nitrotoga arctica]
MAGAQSNYAMDALLLLDLKLIDLIDTVKYTVNCILLA